MQKDFLAGVLTSGAPDYIFLKNVLLINPAVQQFILYVVESKPCDGICKAFSGNTLITEEQDCVFDQIKNFFFCGKNLI